MELREKRSNTIQIKVTDKEKDIILNNAKKLNLTVPDYLRLMISEGEKVVNK